MNLRSAATRASLGLTGLALVVSPLSVSPSTTAVPERVPDDAAQVDVPVPDLQWRKCVEGLPIRCSSPKVPLDYDKPAGKKLKLMIAKDPADNPDKLIGTLFISPGGPGLSAAMYVSEIAGDLGKKVAARFDIVGIDPRGVGNSAPVACRGPKPKLPKSLAAAFPFTAKQERKQLEADKATRAFCKGDHTASFDHMSTADTARDMDLIRQAVGDEQLTYYGVSYGTYLGQTYAAMFPDRVRALVIDGVLDPVAWSTGYGDSAKKAGFSSRLKSGKGAYEALVSAVAECDRVGKSRCAAAGNALGKWQAIMKRLKKGPLMMQSGKLRYPDVVSHALSGTYWRGHYPQLATYIQDLYEFVSAKPASRERRVADEQVSESRRVLDRIWRSRQERGLYSAGRGLADSNPDAADRAQIKDPFFGVACADSVNPSKGTTWVKRAKVDAHTMPWFGRLWTWRSSVCASWSQKAQEDAFRGPWRTKTSNGLLVIGNFYDPATPVNGARTANRLFEGSRLLLMKSWGHGTLRESQCIKERQTRYYLTTDLPRPGVVCRPDKALFPKRHHT